MTELQSFRMKIFTALQSQNLLSENVYDSFAINHVIENEEDDANEGKNYRHLAQSRGSKFFQGDKDITESLMEMQIVNTIHNGKAESAPLKTFRKYYNHFIAVERYHKSEAEFTLQRQSKEGLVTQIKVTLSLLSHNLSRDFFVIKVKSQTMARQSAISSTSLLKSPSSS